MKSVGAIAIVAVFVAGCGREAGPPAGGGRAKYPRKSALVLYQKKNDSECRIKGASEVHAFYEEIVQWEVWNFCDADAKVELRFENIPGKRFKLADTIRAEATAPVILYVDILADAGSYKYSLVVNSSVKEDPRVEVDP